jgi:hypothetical protein
MRRWKPIRKGFTASKFTNWYPMMMAALITNSVNELVAPKNFLLELGSSGPAPPRITPVHAWPNNGVYQLVLYPTTPLASPRGAKPSSQRCPASTAARATVSATAPAIIIAQQPPPPSPSTAFRHSVHHPRPTPRRLTPRRPGPAATSRKTPRNRRVSE